MAQNHGHDGHTHTSTPWKWVALVLFFLLLCTCLGGVGGNFFVDLDPEGRIALRLPWVNTDVNYGDSDNSSGKDTLGVTVVPTTTTRGFDPEPAQHSKTEDGAGGHSNAAVIEMLVPLESDRGEVVSIYGDNGLWVIDTKKGHDRNGARCCGEQITWSTKQGGQFDYWYQHPEPRGDTGCITDMFIADDEGRRVDDLELYRKRVIVVPEGCDVRFKSDGVTWRP